MKVEFKTLEIADLKLNEGQINGLPRNPRQWTYDDVEKLKRSICDTPELLELRGLIVYPFEKKYVVVGGNLRLTALRALGVTNAPCVVLPYDMGLDELAAIVIKDNGSFGKWDEILLKQDWADVPFAEWGIDVFEFPSEELANEKPPKHEDDRKELSITLSAREFEFVNCALRDINEVPELALLSLLGYGECA